MVSSYDSTPSSTPSALSTWFKGARTSAPRVRNIVSQNSQNRLSTPRFLDSFQLFGFLGPGMTGGMEGVTSNGSTYPSWTGPRADWRAILSSLINARVMDSVGFKPACSCWRHNRQDTTTLATLDTITMLQLATLSLCFCAGFPTGFFHYLRCINLRYPSRVQHSQKRISRRIEVTVTSQYISYVR